MIKTIEGVNDTRRKLKTIFISVSHFLQFPGRDLRTITLFQHSTAGCELK